MILFSLFLFIASPAFLTAADRVTSFQESWESLPSEIQGIITGYCVNMQEHIYNNHTRSLYSSETSFKEKIEAYKQLNLRRMVNKESSLSIINFPKPEVSDWDGLAFLAYANKQEDIRSIVLNNLKNVDKMNFLIQLKNPYPASNIQKNLIYVLHTAYSVFQEVVDAPLTLEEQTRTCDQFIRALEDVLFHRKALSLLTEKHTNPDNLVLRSRYHTFQYSLRKLPLKSELSLLFYFTSKGAPLTGSNIIRLNKLKDDTNEEVINQIIKNHDK